MLSTMSLKIGPEDNPNNVDIYVFCGWETASSQIRICIVLSAIYTAFLAHRSIINESKSLADRVSTNHIFLTIFDIILVFEFGLIICVFDVHNGSIRFSEYI